MLGETVAIIHVRELPMKESLRTYDATQLYTALIASLIPESVCFVGMVYV